MAVLALIAGLGAWRLRLSPWWILIPGLIATAVAILLYSPVASCDAAQSVSLAFGGAIIFAVGFHLGAALAAVIDGVRLARERAYRRAALRLLPFLVGAALAVATLALALFSLLGCLS
jgi:hypothetical protein